MSQPVSRLTFFIAGMAVVLIGLGLLYRFAGFPAIPGGSARIESASETGMYTVKPPPAATAEIDESLVAQPVVGPFAPSFKLALRRLLEDRDFDRLDELLDSLQQAAATDPGAREKQFIASLAFQLNDETYATLLTEWIDATPGHAHPYLARANYYYRQAMAARGQKWASETTAEQFAGMKAYLSMSLADLTEAKKRSGRLLEIYRVTIGIAKMLGQDDAALRALDEALAIDPADYYVRAKYLESLQPRWGGSMAEMQSFAKASLAHLSDNPKLLLLVGLVHHEAGNINRFSKAYTKAEENYTEALTFGDNYQVYLSRARNRYYQEQYAEALADLDRALELYAEMADIYYWRSKTRAQLAAYEAAAVDLVRAMQLDPGDASIIEHRDWLAGRIAREAWEILEKQDYDRGMRLYNHAVMLDPDRAKTYYWRGRALARLNQLALAERDLKKSIALDPGDYPAHEMLDWVLARGRRFPEVVSMWDRFLELEPDNANAYLERGGAYFRMGQYEPALADAKKSADLGNPQGEETYQRYKHLLGQ